MKIRTDFVTNSSSSSFIVNPNMKLADGLAIIMQGRQWTGDDDSFECLLRADTLKGETVELANVQLYGYEETEDLGKCNALNLVKIADAPHVEAMISAITRSLCYDNDFSENSLNYTTDPECMDDEDEDFDDAYGEDANMSETGLAGNIRNLLEEHLTQKKDLKELKMEIEMGGYGEGTPNAEDVIDYLFGDGGSDVEYIFEDTEDEEETLERLKELKLFHRFTNKSLKNLIELATNDEVEGCVIKLRLDEKGKIHMEFTSFDKDDEEY